MMITDHIKWGIRMRKTSPDPRHLLVGPLKGYWSIRLNWKDRLIYRVENDQLLISSIEDHYDDH